MSVANSNSNILGRLWVERLVGGSIIGFVIRVGGDNDDVVMVVVVGSVVGATVVVEAPVINSNFNIILPETSHRKINVTIKN